MASQPKQVFQIFIWDFWVIKNKGKLYVLYELINMTTQKAKMIFTERDILC